MKIDKDVEATSNQALLKEVYGNRKNAKRGVQSSVGSDEDSVAVPLGKALQNTLDSISNDPVRAARIEEIKQLLQKGGAAEYFKQVSTTDVASSVAEEISLEVLSSKGKVAAGDEE